MKNNLKQITLILGTAREGRQSVQVFDYIYRLLKQRSDISVSRVDIGDFNLNKTIAPWVNSPESEDFKGIAKNSDAFIIITPEYNHSFPGELKMLLDQAMEEYKNKPVILAGVSAGGFGGARAVEALVPIVSNLGMKYIPKSLHFSNVEEVFKLSEEEIDDKYKENINKTIDELLRYNIINN